MLDTEHADFCDHLLSFIIIILIWKKEPFLFMRFLANSLLRVFWKLNLQSAEGLLCFAMYLGEIFGFKPQRTYQHLHKCYVLPTKFMKNLLQ